MTFLQNKVVVLVTHQIQYLKDASNILVLHQGKITHQGSFETIMKSCTDISSFLTDETEDDDENNEDIKELEEGKKPFF